MNNKELRKVIVKASLGIILLGVVLSLMGFSLSGFEINKYKVTDKKWYQIISYQSKEELEQ